MIFMCVALVLRLLQGVDGSDLVYAPGASDAAGGLMEASYRNLQEARVVLQAAHALITAGGATHCWLGQFGS
jgi:L-asparaginase/Glu-tRNA(Gln) amidotransferase subunit D